ncbi:hypothetical protein AMAG_07058 [Allomyces macrogynus ATCC 38327]|uniref:Ethylene receptor n=2 Tax=Allomyces macrogynus TaxID=28583 RepID=A0A0L0SFU1_ALLM3|nr:putative ethylene receptor 2 [Allomyces macrogynus]KNE61322.1 hypothetical protein AMAG_07058 [Allomyces macrogynus ATCC 38327]|eukprot:KNE61322.1 hypothetical protein AMAG_07058 [Allomyces macrogynus ATCC 38327]
MEVAGIVSDALIAIAYFAIPCQIVYFSRFIRLEGRGVQFKSVIILFELFILLCGLSHLIKVWTADNSWLMTIVKVLTAIVSITTSALLVKLMPVVLKLPERLFVLEEELGLRIQNEQQLQAENSNLQKLRSITQSIRRTMHFQSICDIACIQLTNHFDMVGCCIFALDLPGTMTPNTAASPNSPTTPVNHATSPTSNGNNSDMALCLAEYSRLPPATSLSASSPSTGSSPPPSGTHLVVNPSGSSRQGKMTTAMSMGVLAALNAAGGGCVGVGATGVTKGMRIDLSRLVATWSKTGEWRRISATTMHGVFGISLPRSPTNKSRATLTRADSVPENPLGSGDGVALAESYKGKKDDDDEEIEIRVLATGRMDGSSPTSDRHGDANVIPEARYGTLAMMRVQGRRLIVLMMHEHEDVHASPGVVQDALGQVEIALDQSLQIEQEASRRSQMSVLETEKREAEALNGMKTVFLATISHELRTPMNAIIGFVDLLLTQYELSRDMRDILEIVSVSSSTLLNLVNDILDLSKLEFQGKQFTIEEAPLSILNVTEESVEVVYSQAERKSIKLNAILDHCVDLVLGDKLRVRQILVNLLSNAIKFTSQGSVTVTVSTKMPNTFLTLPPDHPDFARLMVPRKQRVLDYSNANVKDAPAASNGPRTQIYFQVCDTGIGVEQDKMHLLFEKFQQVDATIARRFHGTGLGLAITSRLVELHRGRVWVDSLPGVGTLFTIMLTFTPAPANVTQVPDEPAAPSLLSAASAHGSLAASADLSATSSTAPTIRIAVLDSCPIETRAIATLLKRMGCEAAAFESVAALVAAVEHDRAFESTRPLSAIVTEEDFVRALTGDDSQRLATLGLPVVTLVRIKSSSRMLIGEGLYRHTATKPLKLRTLEATLRGALEYHHNQWRRAQLGAGDSVTASQMASRDGLAKTVSAPDREAALLEVGVEPGSQAVSEAMLVPVPDAAATAEVPSGAALLAHNVTQVEAAAYEVPTSATRVAGGDSGPNSGHASPKTAAPRPLCPKQVDMLRRAEGGARPAPSTAHSSSTGLSPAARPEGKLNVAGAPVMNRSLASLAQPVLFPPARKSPIEAVRAGTAAVGSISQLIQNCGTGGAGDGGLRDTLSSLKVLVVDDNNINQMVAARTLKTLGIDKVDTANNGQEAVTYFETHPTVSIIFMDVSMPILDGLDATRAILARSSHAPPGQRRRAPFICAMTASALPEERNTCLSTGMHDFVPKPTRRQDLMQLLDRYFTWRAAQDEEEAKGSAPLGMGLLQPFLYVPPSSGKHDLQGQHP